jgi:hypothetical protein
MKKLGYLILAVPLIMASCSRDPIADFFVSRNIVDVGESVFFTNNSYDADYFEWDFGDGTRSTAYDAKHIYQQEGIYTVTLFAFSGQYVDKATAVVEVLYPTSLEVIVLEYYDEYAVQDASVLLYPTLDDWIDQTNDLVEGFTNQYGEVIFSNLNSQRYYIDVLEDFHHNYWLAEEDVAWIETHVLVPNELNTFFAYVDYVEPEPGLKSSVDGTTREIARKVAKIRKLEKVDARKFEEKKESIRKKMEERKKREEQSKKLDEIKK